MLQSIDKNTVDQPENKIKVIKTPNVIAKLEKNINNKLNKIDKTITTISKQVNYPISKQVNYPINNQLIELVVEKSKIIEELKVKTTEETKQVELISDPETKIKELVKSNSMLTLNNIVITSREKDNYINATELCKAGGKKFNDWYRLDNTKELINELQNETVPDTGIPVSELHSLIEINKGGNNKNNQATWIHPDLAIQLAQWINPKFALQVSKWIRELFTNGFVSILTDKEKELQAKEKELKANKDKIKLLEDTYVRKQKRIDYPESNVIYILTTDVHKKKKTYIIGKAKKLKNRLSTYNKTCEHEVVYYKGCKSEEDMNFAELLVLNKLKAYREKANRDRFVLPVDKDINFFIDIINKAVNF
jgi:hypothetical protein